MRALLVLLSLLMLFGLAAAPAPAVAHERDWRGKGGWDRGWDRDGRGWHDRDRYDRRRDDDWRHRDWHDPRSFGPRGHDRGWDRCTYVRKRVHGGWKDVRICRDRSYSSVVVPLAALSVLASAGSWADQDTIQGTTPALDLPPPPPGRDYGPAFREADGRYCREYQTEGWIGGRLERLYGRVCMTEGGDWAVED